MAEAENKDENLDKNLGGEGATDNKPEPPAEGGGEGDGISDYVPEVRKTAADYFQERHEDSRPPTPSKVDGGEGEELTPEAAKLVAKEVERQVRERLKPYTEIVVNQANESEINSFLSDPAHDVYKKYRTAVTKIMDAYKGITAENAFILADAKFGNPAQRGAEEEKARQREARKAKGGSSPRPPARAGGGEISAEEIQAMTPEQFAAFNERIKGGTQVKTQ